MLSSITTTASLAYIGSENHGILGAGDVRLLDPRTGSASCSMHKPEWFNNMQQESGPPPGGVLFDAVCIGKET